MLTRRTFLRGKLDTEGSPLRPPWALTEPDFLQSCTRCSSCLQACPENIIISESGFPTIEFSKGECTFCGDCAAVCETGSLNYQRNGSPWFYRAVVKTNCLASQGVVCQSCQDQCEPMAIRFKHRPGLVPEPEIDLQTCTGCGACVQACPANAIIIESKKEDILNV